MSRLSLIQAEYRARQQEEKENKLIAMLEEQQERALRAVRSYSGNSNGSNSISSSSSTTSSLGSNGGGGKVRQMFEERRSQHLVPPSRPPVYAKQNSFRRPPVVPKSRPLDPVPRIPPPKRAGPLYKPRGTSLERKISGEPLDNALRRSRSQYYVNGGLTEARTIQQPKYGYVKSVTSLTDNNHNTYTRNALSNESILDHEYEYPRFDDSQSPLPDNYMQPIISQLRSASRKSAPVESSTDIVDTGHRPLSNIERLRAQFENGNGAEDEYAEIRLQQLEIARMKQLERDEEIRRQQIEARRRQDEAEMSALRKREEQIRALREKEALMKRQQEDIKRQQEEIKRQQESRRKQMELEAELKRRKEAEELEKKKMTTESKRREDELLKKIKEQEEELKRLQAASRAATAETSEPQSAPLIPPKGRAPPAKRVPPARYQPNPPSTSEESDDSKSTTSDGKPVLPPKPTSASSSRGSSASSSNGSAGSRRSVLSATRNDLVPCSVCGRNFAPDRVEKHQSVCVKTTKKKRKVFDVTKMRVKGTEAESFVTRKTKLENSKTFKGKAKPGLHLPEVQPLEPSPPPKEEKKADWRRKHESFLETIRAAKVMQKHLAAGGKLSDLPPPPPSDTSDYIQCPHCERRFSPAAADRHIPKCEGIRSNKKKH